MEELLRPEDIATLLGVAKKTLANWRSENKGPPYVKVGRLARYRLSDVEQWAGHALQNYDGDPTNNH